MSKERKDTAKALDNLYAKNGVVNLGQNPRYAKKVRVNRPSIDFVTDGGVPTGRVILVAGEKSSGKSSLVIQLADIVSGEVEKLHSGNGKILYVDTEYTLTTDYIESLGANPLRFDHAMPESTEKMCDLIREKVGEYSVIVIDSINNSSSEEQLEKNADQKTMANRASVLSAQLPIITGLCSQHNVTLFVISQIRQNINKKGPYDKDYVIPGGESLQHNATMIIEMKPSTKKKEAGSDFELYDTIGGRMINIHVSKNKVGKPFRTVQVEFTYEKGFTEIADVISSAQRLNIIESKGAWYVYGEDTKFQGEFKLKQAFENNKELYEKLKSEVLIKFEEEYI